MLLMLSQKGKYASATENRRFVWAEIVWPLILEIFTVARGRFELPSPPIHSFEIQRAESLTARLSGYQNKFWCFRIYSFIVIIFV